MSDIDTAGGLKKIRRALLSVTDKAGLVEFAEILTQFGVALVSTGGTASVLRKAGLTVQDVSELTGFPEMLDGRVKTLHPKVHGGLLHRRDRSEHVRAVEEHGILPIDMIVVNLYAFEKTAAKPGVSLDELIENVDVGGPSMLRSAAKNFQDVAVVCRVTEYTALADELKQHAGALSAETRWHLARIAFATTAAYDTGIATALEARSLTQQPDETSSVDMPVRFPSVLRLSVPRRTTLRYGENPHQKAAVYADGSGSGVAGAEQLGGKELSFNNLVDLDACWALVSEFSSPAVAIVKHTNPCGVGEGATVAEAYRRALASDPVSAFGGVIGVNATVDQPLAAELVKVFVEAIVAPDFTEEAFATLSSRRNLRLLRIRSQTTRTVLKQISGGFLLQEEDRVRLDIASLQVPTKRQPTPEELNALLFGWTVCKHVKSNAIVYARLDDGFGQTVGVGAGQMSRVDAARFGALKAILPLEGSVAASDAFFPFPDGVETVAQAGATAVIQPGGSVRDADVVAAADRLGLAMVLTGIRHFRHG